jgi:hypothetical protein
MHPPPSQPGPDRRRPDRRTQQTRSSSANSNTAFGRPVRAIHRVYDLPHGFPAQDTSVVSRY